MTLAMFRFLSSLLCSTFLSLQLAYAQEQPPPTPQDHIQVPASGRWADVIKTDLTGVTDESLKENRQALFHGNNLETHYCTAELTSSWNGRGAVPEIQRFY